MPHHLNLFLDAEWYPKNKIFLIGFAHERGKKFKHGQLYSRRLTRLSFRKLFAEIKKGFVFIYGPDIGVCESYFRWQIRKLFKCVNLLKIFKRTFKALNYKLEHLERKFGLKRKVRKYKTDIFHIWRDWRNPKLRYAVLTYNSEDVMNLVRLKQIVFKKYNIKNSFLKQNLLQ